MPLVLPAIVVGLEITAAAILTVLGLAFVFYVAVLLFKALFHPLKAIPFGVGNWIVGQLDRLAETFHSAMSHLLADRVAPLSKWFTALAHEIVVSWDTVGDFTTTLADDLEAWTKTGLHNVIKAFTNPILTIANGAHAIAVAVRGDLFDFKDTVDARFDGLRRFVETELFGRAMAGIDKLRSDVFDRAIPAIRGEIGSLVGTLRGEIVTVEHGLEGLGSDLAALAKRLDIPLAVLEALVASIGLAAAIEAVETLGTCRGKLKTLCTSDPLRWANLIEGLALLAAFPGLVELTRMAQGILSDHRDEIRSVIVGGQRN